MSQQCAGTLASGGGELYYYLDNGDTVAKQGQIPPVIRVSCWLQTLQLGLSHSLALTSVLAFHFIAMFVYRINVHQFALINVEHPFSLCSFPSNFYTDIGFHFLSN